MPDPHLPANVGTGGYVMECTHQISGDGSEEAPYTYATIEDFLADWTNHKFLASSSIFISAPMGGHTLNVNARYADSNYDYEYGSDYEYDEYEEYEPFRNYWLSIYYQNSDGDIYPRSVSFLESNGSFTFDANLIVSYYNGTISFFPAEE